MMTAKLFIASVYAPSPWNRQWYQLQRDFIAQYTGNVDYTFGVLLNGISADELPADAYIIGANSGNTGHSAAMAQLVDLFRQADGYSHFLFLDSDCFPVRTDWFAVLCEQMQCFNKRFAAPVRTENLDRFPHPCAFFCDASAIHDPRINFDIGHEATNLLGEVVRDVGNAMLSLMLELLPLMRSNTVNYHPVAAGVYHHLFYHHGAGSRHFEFRVMNKYRYYDHWWDSAADELLAESLRTQLFQQPHDFLQRLMQLPAHPC